MAQELVIPFSTLESGLALVIGANPTTAVRAVVGALHRCNAGGHLLWAATSVRAIGTQADWPQPSMRQVAPPNGWLAVQWLGNESVSNLSRTAWEERIAALRASQQQTLRSQPLLVLLVNEAGQMAGQVASEAGMQPLSSIRLPGPGMARLGLGHDGVASTSATPDYAESRFSRLAGAIGPSPLRELQRSTFSIVGGGRVGSYVASTLVRYGASVVIFDPDVIEQHNANDSDGLLPSIHEGQFKCAALARTLKPLARPGAAVEGRRLGVSSKIAAHLIASTDMVISAVDNDPARLWATVWASAAQLPHLDIGLGLPLAGGAGADVRLVLPPEGCLECQGGFADYQLLLAGVVNPSNVAPDFGVRRRGSSRSLGLMAANLGVRLIEQLFEGRIHGHRFVQLQEDAETGALQLQDAGPQRRGQGPCLLCGSVAGIGVAAIDRNLVNALSSRVVRRQITRS